MSTAELIIAVAAAAVVTWFVLRRERRDTADAPPGATHAPAAAVTVPPAVDDHIRSLVGQHRKIYAIKELRRQTGMSLRDAKEFVDRL